MLVTLVVGCAQPVHTPEDDWVPTADTPAAQAAAQYLVLAARVPAQEERYRLLAAERYELAGQLQQALEALPVQVSPPRQLLQARLQQALGQPVRVLQALQGQPPRTQRQQWLELRYQARAALQDPAGVAMELTLLEGLPAEVRADLELRLWALLEQAELAQLRSMDTAPGEAYSGWVELAILGRNLPPEEWQTALVYWQQAFPEHPAMQHVVPHLQQRRLQRYPRPQRIAVLLPDSGPFLKAAQAIREGILHVWYRDPARPELHFYDTQQSGAVPLLEQAVQMGAEFVIGPLQKEALHELAISASRPAVPIIGLNHVDVPVVSSGHYFVQFGLAPEDEAVQIAEQAWLEGHRTALAVLPDDDWGQRTLQAFQARWGQLGGRFLERALFDPEHESAYVDPVRPLLNIDSSQRRHEQLQARLDVPLKSELRPRQDADFIFLAAPPLVAAQVVLQLRFYNAGEVPIYATSRVHYQPEGSELDRELDGIRFIDMPARLQDSPLRTRMAKRWHTPNYERLFAFGADAYSIIAHLGLLSREVGSHYPGLSGYLLIGTDGVVRRRLQWAEFREGLPRPELLYNEASP